MTKWEYVVTEVMSHEQMNARGSEGWEIISVPTLHNHPYIFWKRAVEPKPEPKTPPGKWGGKEVQDEIDKALWDRYKPGGRKHG